MDVVGSQCHCLVPETTRCAAPGRMSRSMQALHLMSWLGWPAASVRQVQAQWQLRRRLARHGRTVPALRIFSAQAINDIGRALDVFASVAGDQDARDSWAQVRTLCLNGHRAGVDAYCTLVRHGVVKPNQLGPDGDALLHALVRSGIAVTPMIDDQFLYAVSIEERIQLLAACGADPDQPNGFGDVPLQLAWQRSSDLGDRAAGALLAAGCNPMKRDSAGLTLLHRAARCNDLAVLRGWCSTGLQTSPTGGVRDGEALWQTPLMFAVMAGHRDSVDLLIDKERRLIERGEACIVEGYRQMDEGQYRADNAAEAIAAAERLLAQGRDLISHARAALHFSDRYGATALHWAIDYDRPAIAGMLLHCGVDRGVRAGSTQVFSWTSMQLAAARKRLRPGRPILPLLLKYGVHPDQPLQAMDQRGWRRECEKFQR